MKYERNQEYYEGLDKRTKDYKEWKEWQESLPQGLGDTIASVTKATGLDKVAKSVASLLGFDDCGCDARKDRLNKEFRYQTPNCLEEDDFVWLSQFLTKSRTRVLFDEQKELLRIYNYVFSKNIQPSSCGGCLRRVINELGRVLKAHKNE